MYYLARDAVGAVFPKIERQRGCRGSFQRLSLMVWDKESKGDSAVAGLGV